jgi:alkylhydroperoxidase family enzyme
MSRIPTHSVDDAPPASRELLTALVDVSPTGRLLNLHAQMAHSPAVLTAYTSIRRATGELGTLDQPVRTALMLAAAAVEGNTYTLAVITMLARRLGWASDRIAALSTGGRVGEARTDALVSVVREAAGNGGRVSDATWAQALAAGCTDLELAEAYSYLGLIVFTAHFLTYAQTELDLPTGPESATVAAVHGHG